MWAYKGESCQVPRATVSAVAATQLLLVRWHKADDPLTNNNCSKKPGDLGVLPSALMEVGLKKVSLKNLNHKLVLILQVYVLNSYPSVVHRNYKQGI